MIRRYFLKHPLSICLILTIILVMGCKRDDKRIIISSKLFTESVLLENIVGLLLESKNVEVKHIEELGGTQFLWRALIRGDIDIYPDYTGTIAQEIFAGQEIHGNGDIRRALKAYGIEMSRPLGFNNTYAIGMKKRLAKRLNIQNISDLKYHPTLKLGFSNEFMNRNDGWPGLKERYQLTQRNVQGLEHALAYQGLESDSIQAIDLYMTDAEIQYYDLKVLKDDLKYFPDYDAVLLYRTDAKKRIPRLTHALSELEGTISEQIMVKLNSQVKTKDKGKGKSEAYVAAQFLKQSLSVEVKKTHESTLFSRFIRRTKEHFFLVGISLFMAILLAIPLGIVSSRSKRIGQLVLTLTGVIQTIPSLVLLVFMIPLLGISEPPAIVALFLYSLLPIVRSTYTGIQEIPQGIRESAEAIGLPSFAILRLIEIPLAARSILSGIKTSAVINVGTATLGAFIGAGGYGQPILTGLRKDFTLIWEGAIPAALMALLIQWGFDLSERLIVPKGLRIKSE